MGNSENIKAWFRSLLPDWDGDALKSSIGEVLALTFIALLPLGINILLAAAQTDSLLDALKTKIIPGEIFSYTMSFLAPSLYLVIKIHKTDYKLPFVGFFVLSTYAIYGLSLVIFVAAKNKWSEKINLEEHPIDFYFVMALIICGISLIYRVFSVYHTKGASTYQANRKRQQDDFNTDLIKGINEQK